MFEPAGFGKTIFDDKYTHFVGESWSQACLRLSSYMAGAETAMKMQKWQSRFFTELSENRLMPGGRIWYGAGRPKGSLLNCFVIPVEDNIEGWGDGVKEMMIISSLGGGVGINCSPIRYRGADLKGRGGFASGPISEMRIINAVGDELSTGGGRRMALMLCLDLTHPDIEMFLDAKLAKDQLNNANISVVLDIPTDEFIKAVKNDEEIPLKFQGQKRGSIKAKAFWHRLVQNAWENGEPGVLNGDLANVMNNIWYHSPLISTNPCGEIWLEPYGCCCLGSLVLPRFVKDGAMDWEQLEWTIRVGVRFLDNVLSVNHYPFQKIKDNCETVRRIGLGVMGLHTLLLNLGMKYSSPEAQIFSDRLFSFIKHAAYGTSVKLAIEKGPFPAFDEKMIESGFMKTMKSSLRRDVMEYGIRNCAMLTIAPTGTTSLVSGVSSGIEPYVAPVSWRNYKVLDSNLDNAQARQLVVIPEYVLHKDNWEDISSLDVRSHFEMQRIAQAHIDNAVSKTINLPTDYPVDELADMWLEYLPYMKGSTFYRNGSRDNQPIEPILPEEADRLILENKDSLVLEGAAEAQVDIDCITGVCEVLPLTSAPESAMV